MTKFALETGPTARTISETTTEAIHFVRSFENRPLPLKMAAAPQNAFSAAECQLLTLAQ